MHLLIADDHHLLREALVDHLQREWPDSTIQQCHDFDDAKRCIEHDSPSVALLDVYMPGLFNLTQIQSLIEQHPDMKVVMMSGELKPSLAKSCYAVGASGFIPKTMHSAALASVLTMVANGEKYITDLMFESEDSADDRYDLSPREREVLVQLAKGHSNKKMAQHLAIEESTIKLHLRSIFKKMKVSNRTEAVVKAIESSVL